MWNKRRKRIRDLLAVITVLLFICSERIFATENISLPVEMSEDVISIAFPVIEEGETRTFDFILDPQGLIYETKAMRYGGGKVEEGATLLFYNHEGEYDFSKTSDYLTVTNYSTVPVTVTISAQIHDIGEIELAENDAFPDSEACSFYLALVDSVGNIRPLSAEGEVSITFEMQPVPENAYVYSMDDDTQLYQYELTDDVEESDFDIYSFGLTGVCNPNTDWRNIDVHPMVTVVWKVEPVLEEPEVEVNEGIDAQEESAGVPEESVTNEEGVAVSGDETEEIPESSTEVGDDDLPQESMENAEDTAITETEEDSESNIEEGDDSSVQESIENMEDAAITETEEDSESNIEEDEDNSVQESIENAEDASITETRKPWKITRCKGL